MSCAATTPLGVNSHATVFQGTVTALLQQGQQRTKAGADGVVEAEGPQGPEQDYVLVMGCT
jgi:hypothetical protein